jgi:GxxExxY protein
VKRSNVNDDPLTHRIIGAAIEVHRLLGPGLLESTYEECLCFELTLLGIPFGRQIPLPIVYKSMTLLRAYKPDLLVDHAVIVELKTDKSKFSPGSPVSSISPCPSKSGTSKRDQRS